MALKGGTFLFLLIMTCAALAVRPDKTQGKKQGLKDTAKKLMRQCQRGYNEPNMTMLQTAFKKSDVPSKDGKDSDQSKTPLSSFLDVFNSIVPVEGSPGRRPLDDTDEKSEMMNPTDLSKLIKRMKNFPEASACYMKAFVAPMSWETLSEDDENNMNPDDYDTLLTATEPMVLDMPPSGVNFPDKVKGRDKVKKWMRMLKRLHHRMSKEKRTKVLKWVKEQITQDKFSCTTKPKSDQKTKQLQRCKPSLKWLDSDAMEDLGPFLSDLTTRDIDSIPKEDLCMFFRLSKLKSFLWSVKMRPSLGRKFLKKIKECYSDEKKFESQVEKLSTLACYYSPSQNFTPDFSKKLLSVLDQCDDDGNRQIKKLKKKLMDTWMSKGNIADALKELSISFTSLSGKQLSKIPVDEIKRALKMLGPDVKWTRRKQRILAKKIQGKEKCKEMTVEKLVEYRSVAGGLPRCVFKHIDTSKLLDDTEGLETISKGMSKGHLKKMLKQMLQEVEPSVLLEKLPESLLHRVPLNFLEKANISPEQLKKKTWIKAQALLLMKKLLNKKKFNFRKLGSLLQGVTCKTVKSTSIQDLKEMVLDEEETARWLPKGVIGCAARKFIASLEKDRPDYFETITEEELDDIPTVFLLRLPSKKVKDLPDSVCPVLLDKMQSANLSTLPPSASSLQELTKKTQLCLTQGNNQGTDLSELTIEDVERLGPYLCELPPSEMEGMEPDVLTFSLEEMALRCNHIPERHQADLVQLVIKTYGDVSGWTEEMMEVVGPLTALDDNVISALPNTPWMIDALYFLRSRLPRVSTALEKKLFDLIVAGTSETARRKRAVKTRSILDIKIPTLDLIGDLDFGNVFWQPAELDLITLDDFAVSMDILGDVPDFSADQLDVLTKKATEAFGAVEKMDEDVVIELGCITQGFSNKDLQTLPFSLDNMEEISTCDWKDSQMEPVWQAAAKHNNLTAEKLDGADLALMDRFICGMNSNEMQQINKDAFKEALDSINDLQCSSESVQQLGHLTVSAFGSPRDWSEAQVADVGNLIAGLDATELASLDPAVFSSVSQSAIPLIPPSFFAALSAEQLEALGPDNAAMVTKEQQAALRKDQLSAVGNAMAGTVDDTGTRNQTMTPPESGAPSLTAEGILSVTQPFLFLLMGFLLL